MKDANFVSKAMDVKKQRWTLKRRDGNWSLPELQQLSAWAMKRALSFHLGFMFAHVPIFKSTADGWH